MDFYIGCAVQTLILSSASIASCIFVIYCFLKFKALRNDQFAIISKIILLDLLYDIIMFVDSLGYLCMINSQFILSEIPSLCLMQSFLSEYSVIASTFWTSIVCHNLYNTVIHKNAEYRVFLYNTIGFGLPLLISIIPFFINGYGQTQPMAQTNCFFNDQNGHMNIYVLLFFYIPIWIAFIYNCIIMLIVVIEMKRILRVSGLQESKNLYSLFTYPTILAICWVIPGIVAQFNVKNHIWIMFAVGLSAMIGFLDSFLYCYITMSEHLIFKNWSITLIKTESQDQLIFEGEILQSVSMNN